MNEVSIIINGVRYDSQAADINDECDSCDLKEVCDGCSDGSFNRVCLELAGRGYNFKKSTKSFCDITLQEKIDKLPLSVEHDGKVYNLRLCAETGLMVLAYMLYDHSVLFYVKDDRILLKTSFRLEELIDRALTMIENKEWEQL